MRLNLGCGSVTPDGWHNVDYAIGARVARWPLVGTLAHSLGIFDLRWDNRIVIYDLSKPFPWRDNSVDVIYSSHTLEHFDRAQGRQFLTQCYRVLRPGGTIRIVVPDLAAHVERYTRGSVSADAFLEDLDVLYGIGKTGLKRLLAPFVQYPHKCMYDQSALLKVVSLAGFRCQARRAFESDIPDVASIELQGRTVDAVIVEGTKPFVLDASRA